MSRKDGARIHVGKGPEMGQKARTPPNLPSSTPSPNPPPVFTSISQKKKYITVEGIVSDISYPGEDWPNVALKELPDNAYEFYVINYPNATAEARKVSIRIKIDTQTYSHAKIFRIAVRNSNVDNLVAFPELHAVFDYDRWGSTKRDQHRMTAGGLGDFLKRVLGMGYALWTANDNPEDTDSDPFEDKQWPEPIILRFAGKEYRIFLVVSGDRLLTQGWDKPVPSESIGTDIEVEAALPLVYPWTYDYHILIKRLEDYYRIFKLIKRNVDFSFRAEIV